MTTHSRRGLLALIGAVGLSLASSAHADVISYNASPYTGSSAQALVTFKDGADALTAGTVDVTVSVVPNPNIGDLRGFFVNVANESLLPGLTVTGTHVTQVLKAANAVDNLGGGVNSNPEGPFDLGIEIGTPGIGSDDISSSTFTFAHNAASLTNALLTSATDPVDASGPNALLFAVRMTSVGPLTGQRDGSSKLGGDGTTVVSGGPGGGPGGGNGGNGGSNGSQEVPEPASLLLWGALAAGAGWLSRRRRARSVFPRRARSVFPSRARSAAE